MWTDLAIKDQKVTHFKETVKILIFFTFKKKVMGAKVISVERRAKNILINLDTGKTILIHLKMTGHLLYGEYVYDKKYNTWIVSAKEKILHFEIRSTDLFTLSLRSITANISHFVMQENLEKVTLLSTQDAHTTKHLENIGPEPLDDTFTKRSDDGKIIEKTIW